jgi:hypothetical protein
MKIHEISRWNEVHPRNTICNYVPPWNVVYSQFNFLHQKSSKFHGWTCMNYHIWIFNGGVDKSSSMQLKLLGHPRVIYGSSTMNQTSLYIILGGKKKVLC